MLKYNNIQYDGDLFLYDLCSGSAQVSETVPELGSCGQPFQMGWSTVPNGADVRRKNSDASYPDLARDLKPV